MCIRDSCSTPRGSASLSEATGRARRVSHLGGGSVSFFPQTLDGYLLGQPFRVVGKVPRLRILGARRSRVSPVWAM
eukprot:4202133-Pyramimonas_sp.AAC.1